ncbi:MAG TPA: apolipoprotein N-acyltransferase, partial [Minicystis sp.]|nr:apolipoprotein N-acyltransferase [Minicystis sp.]
HPGILRTLRELTRRVEAEGAELTIWPEAAYPYALDHAAPRADHGGRALLGGGVRGPILFGLITRARDDDAEGRRYDSYNSATLVGRDGRMETPVDKLQLLWFGETVPGSATFPWLGRLFQRSGGLVPGTAPRALDLPRDDGPALRMAVLNCYEDTLTSVGRRVTADLAPNLLVNVTNDAWFDDTAESELHARLAAMRAVESRHDLVRAVNLGVMTWVDAAGVVRARWDASRAQTLLVTPAVDGGELTPYTRFGDAPCLALFAVCGLAAWLRSRKRTATEHAAALPSRD